MANTKAHNNKMLFAATSARNILALTQAGLLCSMSLALPITSAAAALAQKPSAKAAPARAAADDGSSDQPAAPARDYSAPVLANLARDYKAAPDEVTWGKYFNYLRDLLASGDFSQANAGDLIAANPSLNDLHVKVIDVGCKNMRLWSFPSISENHGAIFAAPGKVTAIPLPLSVVLREGRVVPSSFVAPASFVTTSKVVKAKGKNGARILKTVKTVHKLPANHAAAAGPAAEGSLAAYGKYLVLIGGDRQSNALWLKGFKLGDGPLQESPELFSSLPAFFSQNVTGKATFSGSDIVLTIQPPTAAATKDVEEKPDVIIQSNGKAIPAKAISSAVAGYKVMLKYMGGKFGLSGHLADDAPLSVALAFAQNICSGHPDVAKAWLMDPKLVSIPKYLGLVGRSSPPMRLVAMSGASGSRYRLVTAAKDDLIIDVGRITTPGKMKGQLAIKGLFVAPPDPYAARLSGTPVLPKETDPSSADDDADGGTTSGAAAAARAGAKPSVKTNVKANLKAR